METATNPTLDTSIAMAEVIAENFCKQIIAFQNAITNREPGLQFPSPQEINLLCKLVNCLAKMKRLAAPIHSNKAIKSFVSFLTKDNKELAKIVNPKYKEYIKEPENDPTTEGVQVTEQVQTPTDNDIPVETTTTLVPVPKIADCLYRLSFDVPAALRATTPSITEAEFIEYKDLLELIRQTKNPKTEFRGQMCNTNWMQYNLFQYLLPVEDRNFIIIEKQNNTVVNHYYTQNSMRKYLWDHNLI